MAMNTVSKELGVNDSTQYAPFLIGLEDDEGGP